MKRIIDTLLIAGYKYTFCKDYKHCLGYCGRKWTKAEKQQAIAASWQ